MPMQSATATGADLSTVLTSALADLLDDDDVRIQAHLPEGVGVADVRVQVEAAVDWDDEPSDQTDDDADEDDANEDDADEDDADEDDADEVAATPAVADADEDPAVAEVEDDPDVTNETDDEADATDHSANDGEDADAALLTDEELDELDEEADAGADFVEGLLDAMDLPGELQIRIIEETRRAEVEVVDMNSGALIGRRGSTLEAIQELMRCALQSQFERRVHVHVDVEGYRARRLEKLLDKADEVIDDVLDSGESERLEPMDVFERKAIHEFVNTVEGVVSRSQGREPSRRVVIELAD